MTADSIIPDALDGQSYNRYSYVGNGPLSATDPSGHDDCKIEGLGCLCSSKTTAPATLSRAPTPRSKKFL